MRYSIEHSAALAESLFTSRRFHDAKNMLSDILNEVPDEASCRRRARDCLRNLSLGDKTTFLERCVSQFLASQPKANDAIAGWTYSILLERHFNLGHEQAPARGAAHTSLARLPSASIHQSTAYGLLSDMLGCGCHETLFQKMKWISSGLESATRFDSFSFGNKLDAGYFDKSSDCINICIIGGGCCGLTLANSLKFTFGSKIRVLVIENRVESKHQKLPYSRRWLTHLHRASVDSFIDPLITNLLARVSQDRLIGVPIYIFETLLMLSSKCLGVDFYFGEYSELPELEYIHFDLLFDATGGRMRAESKGIVKARENGPSYLSKQLAFYTAGFERFGIPQVTTPDSIEIETAWFGNRLRPLIDGDPITLCNLKITGVSVVFFENLIIWCRKCNHDAKFYVWPGNLIASINELLIFVCLNAIEAQQFSQLFTAPIPIQLVVDHLSMSAPIDPRIRELFQILAEQDTKADCYVEPPYYFRPYLSPATIVPETSSTKIAIPIGDSVYNGNPKVGNGLARHLRHVRRIHDIFVANWGA